ncbi:MAG: hypothetical protein IJ612_01400 [Prevotella sp.]|nr:hypothetical protein [Prevotella sp.]
MMSVVNISFFVGKVKKKTGISRLFKAKIVSLRQIRLVNFSFPTLQERMDCGTKAYGLRYKSIAFTVQRRILRGFWLQAKDLSLTSKRLFAYKQKAFRLQAKGFSLTSKNISSKYFRCYFKFWPALDFIFKISLYFCNCICPCGCEVH